MKPSTKGALIFGGLALLSVLASRCHADPNDTLKCPTTIYVDESFQVTLITKRLVHGYRVEDGSGAFAADFTPPFKDSATVTLMVKTTWGVKTGATVRFKPTVNDRSYNGWAYVPIPGDGCPMLLKVRPVVSTKRRALKTMPRSVKTPSDALGRASFSKRSANHAIVR